MATDRRYRALPLREQRVHNSITDLYEKAFACWQRANRQADPSMRASWEATAQQCINVTLAITESRCRPWKLTDSPRPKTFSRWAQQACGNDVDALCSEAFVLPRRIQAVARNPNFLAAQDKPAMLICFNGL
jgi:hypothetical protein